MTDFKHTKGPWQATRSDRTKGPDLWWITANIVSHNGEKDICEIHGGPQTSEWNAHLIAAAPDLLEALAACEKQAEEVRLILINHLNEPEHTAFWKAINIREFARAAIAKAEGRS